MRRHGRRSLAAALVAAALAAALAPAASARTGYIVNEAVNTVSPFNLATNVVGAPITVGKDPRGIVVSPDGRHLYVSNIGDDSVSTIDTATNAVVGKPIAVGDGPTQLAISPDGSRLYSLDLFSDGIGIVDLASGKYLGEIKTVKTPEGVAVSPDGSRLYVTEFERGMTIYDAASGGVVGGPVAPVESLGVPGVTPDGSKVFIPEKKQDQVVVFDTASGAIVGSPIPVGLYPWSVEISPDGQRAYVNNGFDTTVSVFDTASDALVGKPITVGQDPLYAAMAPDGSHLYANTNPGLSVLDTATATATTFELKSSRSGIAIVPDQGPTPSLKSSLGGTTATLDAGSSTDSDGHVASYKWDFGDGTSTSGPGPVVTHNYTPGHTYTARVIAIDDEGCGATRIATGQVVLCNASSAPIATASISVPAAPGARPAPVPPRHRAGLHLGHLKLRPATGTAVLIVRVASAGKLSVGGQALPRTRSAKRAGKVALTIVPRGKAKRALARLGHATVKVRIGFQAPGLLPAQVLRRVGLIEHVGVAGGG